MKLSDEIWQEIIIIVEYRFLSPRHDMRIPLWL